MKKNLFRAAAAGLCLLLMLCLVPLQTAAAAEEEGTVYVTVSLQGQLARTKDGKPAARLPVSLTGESATVDQVLQQLHRDYCKEGEKGYVTGDSEYGVTMLTLWGETEGVGAFYVNGIMPMETVEQARVRDGDLVDLILYRADWSDVYASFAQMNVLTGAGQDVVLQLRQDNFDSNYQLSQNPLADAKISTCDAQGKWTETELVTDRQGQVTLRFEQPGVYCVSAISTACNATAAVCAVTVTPKAIPDYSDIAGKWYGQAVRYVSGQGYFGGISETLFGPETSMNRAMLVTVLWRMAGEPAAEGGASFSDVGEDYYTAAVAWASEKGIVTGYGDGRFGPKEAVTREQLAAFLCRYAQLQGMDVEAGDSLASYSDAAAVSAYALSAMNWAVQNRLIQGSDGALMPKGSATRAQVAAILMRFDSLL